MISVDVRWEVDLPDGRRWELRRDMAQYAAVPRLEDFVAAGVALDAGDPEVDSVLWRDVRSGRPEVLLLPATVSAAELRELMRVGWVAEELA